MKDNQYVDIFGLVYKLRTQRVNMVQTQVNTVMDFAEIYNRYDNLFCVCNSFLLKTIRHNRDSLYALV